MAAQNEASIFWLPHQEKPDWEGGFMMHLKVTRSSVAQSDYFWRCLRKTLGPTGFASNSAIER